MRQVVLCQRVHGQSYLRLRVTFARGIVCDRNEIAWELRASVLSPGGQVVTLCAPDLRIMPVGEVMTLLQNLPYSEFEV